MKLWTNGYDKSIDDFPQIIYKNRILSYEEQAFLTNKIFSLFQLTHRDKFKDLHKIKTNKNELPFKKLYQLIHSDDKYEFEAEYMVYLLNYFSVELD